MLQPRSSSLTPLRDGRVLAVGGCTGFRGGKRATDDLLAAEIFDPRTGAWSPSPEAR
jgi:hypothetical protein